MPPVANAPPNTMGVLNSHSLIDDGYIRLISGHPYGDFWQFIVIYGDIYQHHMFDDFYLHIEHPLSLLNYWLWSTIGQQYSLSKSNNPSQYWIRRC